MNQSRMSNAPAGTEAKGKTNQLSGKGSVAQVGRFEWEAAILADDALSREATYLALVLGHYMNAKTGKCYPSKRKIVADLRYESSRSLEKHRAELTKRGYLEAVYNPKQNLTHYRALLPRDHTPTSVGSNGKEEGYTPKSVENPTLTSVTRTTTKQQPKTKTLESLEVRGCPSSLDFPSLRLGLYLNWLRSSERSDQSLLGDSDIHLKNILAFKERLNNGPRPRMAPEIEVPA